jgi:uncharacterized damage-inducible protein DinB
MNEIMDKSNGLEQMLIDQLRLRIGTESLQRIRICLNGVSEEVLWKAPNAGITSIGNSVLHCIGNADQWLSSILAGTEQKRDRAQEFKQGHEGTVTDLLNAIRDFEIRLNEYVKCLEVINLKSSLIIQGISTNGVDGIVHVIEHFSYHTGQITLLAKLYSQVETNYYGHLNLDE